MDVYKIGVTLAMTSNHAQVLGALSQQLLHVHARVNQLTGGFNRLKLAIGGAMMGVAGGEILRGIVAVVEKTKDLSHELTQLKKLGGDMPANMGRVQAEAWRVTRAVPGMSIVDALRIPGATYSMLGLENSLKVMEPLARFQSVIRNTTGKMDGKDHQQLYQMLRSGELMGAFTDPKTHQVDPDRVSKFLDIGSRVMIGTHGFVTPQTWLGLAQQGGPSLMHLSDKGMYTMGIMSQAMGGPRAGTSMMSLFQQMAGGTMFTRTAEALQELGLLKGNEWKKDHGRVIISESASKRLSSKIGEDPLKWVGEEILPALEKHGVTEPDAQMRWVFKFLQRQTTQRFTADQMRNFMQMVQERDRLMGAASIGASLGLQNNEDAEQALHNMKTAWDNLLYAVAGPNSENVIAVLNSLTNVFNSLSDVVRGMNPGTLAAIGKGIAILGVALVGGGAAAILLALGPVGWITAGIIALGATFVAFKPQLEEALGALTKWLAGIKDLVANFLLSGWEWLKGKVTGGGTFMPQAPGYQFPMLTPQNYTGPSLGRETWSDIGAGRLAGGGTMPANDRLASLPPAGTPGPAIGGSGGGGRANFFSGAPLSRAPTWVTAGGHHFSANAQSGPHFKGFVEDLEALGAPIHSIGGHNVRRIAGSGRWSQHAYGNALDINQHSRNVVSADFARWARSHQHELRDTLNRWGIISGGDWRSPDFGHFEWGGRAVPPRPNTAGKDSSIHHLYLDGKKFASVMTRHQVAAARRFAQGSSRPDFYRLNNQVG